MHQDVSTRYVLPWSDGAKLLAATHTLSRQDHVAFLLGAALSWSPRPHVAGHAGGIGWGRNPRNEALRSICQRHSLPFLTLEDPYFRSWGLSQQKHASPPVGMMLDSRQPAYDCTGQGSEAEWRTARRIADGREQPSSDLRQFIVAARLTKYNFSSTAAQGTAQTQGPAIGVIDQVHADRSLQFGGVSEDAMLHLCRDAIALARQRQARLILRTHPDVRAGKARSALAQLLATQCAQQGMVLGNADTQSPHDFLDSVETVLTLTSGLGFEALLKQKEVVTYAAPFYAGWGLTDDRATAAVAVDALRRRSTAAPAASLSAAEKSRRLDSLVTTMLDDMTLWWDPVHRIRCDAMTALKRLASWAAMPTTGSTPAKVYGIASWKRPAVTAMLAGPGADVSYSLWAAPRGPSEGASLHVWGNPQSLRGTSGITRIEDGFIRSIGLGAHFVRPASLVFDAQGLHYAADAPSDIEDILQTGRGLHDRLVKRAETLRHRIVNAGIDKYNLDASGGPPPGTQPLHMVIGQVIDDESVRQGLVQTLPGEPLVKRVRTLYPEDSIAYRPHPDVMAGLRNGDASSSTANLMADRGSLSAWFTVTKRLHVATSLAGFEALLRGIPVSTYGLPFYAGWGLTEDNVRTPRRTRRITLDELVAATLILYPRYVSILTGLRCEPEDILDEIEAIRRGERAAPQKPKPSSLLRKAAVAVARRTGLRF